MEKQYIFADKIGQQSYSGSEVSDSKDELLKGIEYADVAGGMFQLWEYPSGEIYDIIPDRYTLGEDDYTTPSHDTWLPRLVFSCVDKELVASEYNRLLLPLERRRLVGRLIKCIVSKK